jgi:hypothetical protein
MPLIVLLMLAGFAAMVTAEPWQICGSSTYTANSTYQSNLEQLSFFTGTDPSRLFDKTFEGDVPDKVYGVALCRGDMDPDACSTCVSAAFLGARQRCSLSKDATIFYDKCLLRFSDKEYILNLDSTGRLNASMFDYGALILMNMSSEPMLPAGWDTHNQAQKTNFTQFFRSMLTDIVGQVRSTTAHYAAIRVDTDDGSSTK